MYPRANRRSIRRRSPQLPPSSPRVSSPCCGRIKIMTRRDVQCFGPSPHGQQAAFSRLALSPERCKPCHVKREGRGRTWKERGGASVSLFATPVSPKPKSKRKKLKEAERRQTQGHNRRILRCGARPFGARTLVGVPPRLSARGEYLIPKAQLQARLPGTWSVRAVPAFACPSPGMHLPPRS